MSTDLSVYVKSAPVASRPMLVAPADGWALVPAPAADDLTALCSVLNSPGEPTFFTDSSAA
ncbi:hypothetical protein [Kitasatospora sp. NPDC127116]|uniref:hypothetical protein n=1 Tax=Kitasatospora sp. NPDC127116 TaxID=3345367 RepID=UPI003644516A